MLLMVRTEPAVIRTPVFDLRSVSKRDRARLVELAETRVGFGVPVDQSFEGSTVGTPLRHEHFFISEQDLHADYFLSVRAYSPGDFVKTLTPAFFSHPT